MYMVSVLKKTLAGAVTLFFVLAYTGPAMVCGAACAGNTEVMACCAPAADGTASLTHKCCCKVTDGGQAIPLATPATYAGPDVQESAPAVTASVTLDAPVPNSLIDVNRIHTLTKPPPVYVLACTYLC